MIFTIAEEDLAQLEAELQRLVDDCGERLNDPIVRKRWEAVKSIVSNVRWQYGPPLSVQRNPEPTNER